jgi:hypothetical protein
VTGLVNGTRGGQAMSERVNEGTPGSRGRIIAERAPGKGKSAVRSVRYDLEAPIPVPAKVTERGIAVVALPQPLLGAYCRLATVHQQAISCSKNTSKAEPIRRCTSA